jgi:lysophospholipid acyltransferase (LPLAT)-like uncharacterized protein
VGGPKPREVVSRRRSTWLRRSIYATTAPIAVELVRLLWSTYRFKVTGDEELYRLVEEDRPLILTFWHDSLFVIAWLLVRLGRLGARVTYLISPSQDGEFAVRMLAVVGGRAVRGSATRSGVKAMHGLYRAIRRDNASPVIVPDGPQGPRRVCKPGAVMLAKLSGAAIQPMACAARRGWQLRTWDRLLFPVPFTRIHLVCGASYTVDSDIDSEGLEVERQKLEALLEELGEQVERLAKE